jgi:diadenosine tetraphosphate (Ap4A) HIT family hydrolase
LVKNDEQTFIIINNSPIETGHVLLVPKIHECKNQVCWLDYYNIKEFCIL